MGSARARQFDALRRRPGPEEAAAPVHPLVGRMVRRIGERTIARVSRTDRTSARHLTRTLHRVASLHRACDGRRSQAELLASAKLDMRALAEACATQP